MATRRLENEGWADALARLKKWRSGDLAVCWAQVRETKSHSWAMLGITVRGGITVPDRDYEYAHLMMQSRMERADVVANGLREGHVAQQEGYREFIEPEPSAGTSYWLTSGAVFGMTGPLPTPSFYFSVQITDQQRASVGQLSEPAYGPGQLYYQSGDDALWEVLYGMTRHQGRRDLINQVVIHLPYDDAYIGSVTYIDGKGMVVDIGEGGQGLASGHELQALWKMQFSETSYRRAAQLITHAGSVTFGAGAEPDYFAASLQNEEGQLVDYVEQLAQPAAAPDLAPLPSEALHDALDFLDSAWRNVTDKPLLEVHRVSPAARLAAPVANRSDFASRLSDLAEVFKAMRIDDTFIDAKLAKDLTPDKSLGRLKAAVQKLLGPLESDVATHAVDVLQDVVRVRVAIQHEHSKPDLPTSLLRLGIKSPPDWPQAWEVVRHRAVVALRDLRQALESALT